MPVASAIHARVRISILQVPSTDELSACPAGCHDVSRRRRRGRYLCGWQKTSSGSRFCRWHRPILQTCRKAHTISTYLADMSIQSTRTANRSIQEGFFDISGRSVDRIDTNCECVDKRPKYRHISTMCRLQRQMPGTCRKITNISTDTDDLSIRSTGRIEMSKRMSNINISGGCVDYIDRFARHVAQIDFPRHWATQTSELHSGVSVNG